jgi:hypothetical protein
LARSMGYPATYSDADIRSLCFTFLNAGLSGRVADRQFAADRKQGNRA